MALRTITIGAIAYRSVGSPLIAAWGFHGQEVDVHDDDLERFDAANTVSGPFVPVSAADVPAEVGPVEPAPEPTQPIRPAGNARKDVRERHGK